MVKSSLMICVLTGLVLVAAMPAAADLSWQTQPILGTSVSYTGDVVVVTGPTPVTIPHYSIPGDPLYGIGDPSMTLFIIDPDTFVDGHMTDTVAKIAFGSGINVEMGHTYHWTSVWTYLGSLQPTYSIVDQDDYYAPRADEGGEGFVMLKGSIENLWAEDVGTWTYVQTWTDKAVGGPSITSDPITFTVAVPAPGAIALGMLGLGLVGWVKRRMA